MLSEWPAECSGMRKRVEPVAFDDCGEVPTGKNQTIVRAEKEFPIDTTKCSKSTDQSML